MSLFCKHQWKSIVLEDHDIRQQECIKCGKIRNIPCVHVWEEVGKSYRNPTYNQSGKIHLYSDILIRSKCKKCGEQKQESF